jgi:GntR family transcriptional repressor for pyruvate dehydrogenase complex
MLANELRARIFEENLEPGTALASEGELIEEHQYSRGTVREALRLLESEGFIAVRRGPKGGITVQYPNINIVGHSLATLLALSKAPLHNLFDFRKLIEPAAAAMAARDETSLPAATLKQFTREDRPDRGTVEFHKLLGECTGNEVMRVILAATYQLVEWQTDLEGVSAEDVKSAGHAHAAIAQAIVDGDEERAAYLMLRHIEAFESVLAARGRLDEPALPRDLWVSYLRQTVP